MRMVLIVLALVLLRPASAEEETSPAVAGFTGYAGVQDFTVKPRDEPLNMFPCSNCHKVLPLIDRPRELTMAHPKLDHGAGRMWCLACHSPEDRDVLENVRGEAIPFEESYLLCGQCHFDRQKDWFFGVHGKRVGRWQGERVLWNCVECHDAHDPAIEPRPPQPPPPVRVGLERVPPERHDPGRVWEKYLPSAGEEVAHER